MRLQVREHAANRAVAECLWFELLVPHGKSLALSCHRGDGGERLPLHGSAAVWLPAGGAGSGSTGHGGRVGDDPPPRKRIFAVFGLVRQRVWIRDSARPGQGGVAGLHPRPRQAATPPAYSSSSTTCRWRSFALCFRRGVALVLFRRTAVPSSVDEGLAVVVRRDKAEELAAAHVVGSHQAQRSMPDVLDFPFHGGGRPHRDVGIPAFKCLHPGLCECERAGRRCQWTPPTTPPSISGRPNALRITPPSISGRPNALRITPPSISGRPNALRITPPSISGRPNALRITPPSISGRPNALRITPPSISGRPNALRITPPSISGRPNALRITPPSISGSWSTQITPSLAASLVQHGTNCGESGTTCYGSCPGPSAFVESSALGGAPPNCCPPFRRRRGPPDKPRSLRRRTS